MLSFSLMFLGTFHMMFPALDWSSQAIVVVPKTLPPEAGTLGFFLNNQTSLLQEDVLHRLDPRRPLFSYVSHLRGQLRHAWLNRAGCRWVVREGARCCGRLELKDGAHKREIVVVEPIEPVLRDLYRSDEPRVPLRRMPYLAAQGLYLRYQGSQASQIGEVVVADHLLPQDVEVRPGSIQSIGDLIPQQLIGDPYVLFLSVSSQPR